MTAILGAGLSGLSVAHYALNNPKITPLVIFEASNRVGGWIQSFKQPDGTIFEKGPRVIAVDYSTLDLLDNVQLATKVIPITSFRSRYIYSDNTLHCLPNSLKGIFAKNTLLNDYIYNILWHDFRTEKVSKDDESIHDFIERRFSKDFAEKFVAPVFCGIFGGDTHQLSAKSCVQTLFEAEQNYGSVCKGLIYSFFKRGSKKKQVKSESKADVNIKSVHMPPKLTQRARKGMWNMFGIKGGFEELPRALAKNITEHGVNIKMKHKCEKLIFNKDYVELTVNGKNERYSRIISSLSAKDLANLIQEQHPELSKELCSIPSVTVATVNLQYSKNLPLEAFGFLVSPIEKIPILGVIFDSCLVPQNCKMTVLTVMMGGAWFKQYFGENSSEEHLKNVAVKYVNKILGIDEDPKAFHVSISKECIPQYTVGHSQRLNRINEYIREHKIPLVLCGSSYEKVGVVGLILSAKQAVSNIN